jgi:hypothetical protein
MRVDQHQLRELILIYLLADVAQTLKYNIAMNEPARVYSCDAMKSCVLINHDSMRTVCQASPGCRENALLMLGKCA